MVGQSPHHDAIDLLKKILARPGGDLEVVRGRRQEIVMALDSEEIDLSYLPDTPKAQDWIRRVFFTLIEGRKHSIRETEILTLAREQIAAAESRIGSAFSNYLLRGAPTNLRQPERIFGRSPEIPYQWEAVLAVEPDVAAAGRDAEPFIRFGISPMTVFYACKAVSDVCRFLIYSNQDDLPVPLFSLTANGVRDEIALLSDVSHATGAVLWEWLQEIAMIKPLVFPGAVVLHERTTNDVLVLTDSSLQLPKEEEVETRWGKTSKLLIESRSRYTKGSLNLDSFLTDDGPAFIVPAEKKESEEPTSPRKRERTRSVKRVNYDAPYTPPRPEEVGRGISLAQRAQKLFMQYLRENNLKITQERLALLDEIFAVDEHLNADDLLARITRKRRKVSRATVYRTLDLLVQCGLVRKSRLGRENYYYEKMEPGGGHHHMVCTATGKIIEFWDAELEERLRALCSQHKFRPTFISIQIQGISKEGQKQQAESDTSFFDD